MVLTGVLRLAPRDADAAALRRAVAALDSAATADQAVALTHQQPLAPPPPLLALSAAETLLARLFAALLAAARSIPSAQLFWDDLEAASDLRIATHVIEALPMRIAALLGLVDATDGPEPPPPPPAKPPTSGVGGDQEQQRPSVFALLTLSHAAVRSRDVAVYLVSGISRSHPGFDEAAADATDANARVEGDRRSSGILASAAAILPPALGGVGSGTAAVVPLLLRLARRGVAARRARAGTVRAVLAACVGAVVDAFGLRPTDRSLRSLDFELHDARESLAAAVDRRLRLLEAVRRNVALLEHLPQSAVATADAEHDVDDDVAAPVLSACTAPRDVDLADLGLTSDRERLRYLLAYADSFLPVDLPRAMRAAARQAGPPPAATRLWLPAAAALAAAAAGARALALNADRLAAFAADAAAAAAGIARVWLVEPLRRVYATVRHDDEEGLALVGRDSLRGDLDSLVRMVVAFAVDRGADPADVESLANAARNGDLTPVLRGYESDIRRPFWNTVSGDLVRTVLIQVQKAKVDMDLAMSALDKLLRANELNFAVLAAVPAVLLAYAAAAALRRAARRAIRAAPRARTYKLIRAGLRDVERILDRAAYRRHRPPRHPRHPHRDGGVEYDHDDHDHDHDDDVEDSARDRLDPADLGLLVCELQALGDCAAALPRPDARAAFRDDLRRLADPAWPLRRRLDACARFHRSYPYIWAAADD
ncbi:Nuclear control of ATPase protein 2 [Cladochytrium tenue]|nr:Nuclear control of ATPase protein 2 [Cladochytrium tenue]